MSHTHAHSHTQAAFQGTNLAVACLTTEELSRVGELPHFDLLYVSIHTFNKLMKGRRTVLEQWNVGVLVVDEYHLMFGEEFRFPESWSALSKVAALGAKVVCMSATGSRAVAKMAARYLGVGCNYKIVGETEAYAPPNVAIRTQTFASAVAMRSRLMSLVRARFGAAEDNQGGVAGACGQVVE